MSDVNFNPVGWLNLPHNLDGDMPENNPWGTDFTRWQIFVSPRYPVVQTRCSILGASSRHRIFPSRGAAKRFGLCHLFA